MDRGNHILFRGLGYSLVELTVVLFLLGVILAVGSTCLSNGARRQESRTSAQCLQAGAAWAQLDVLHHGGESRVELADQELSVYHDSDSCGGRLADRLADCELASNIARWNTVEGVAITFGGPAGSPDSGGSVYFQTTGGTYRVVVRPESGLTIRRWVEE